MTGASPPSRRPFSPWEHPDPNGHEGLGAGPGPNAPSQSPVTEDRVNLRFIDWLWRIRGSVPLEPGQSRDDALDRLEPLFNQTGTRHRRTRDTLTFSKTHPAAQDPMSVFDLGALRIDQGVAGPVLRYDLTSRALLACLLAPLLFLGLAEGTIVLGKFEKPPHEAAKKETALSLNPIDKALGAPAPDKPKKKDARKSGGRNKELSPRPAYTFAEIFVAVYVVGRVLEDRLVRRLFRKSLLQAPEAAAIEAE